MPVIAIIDDRPDMRETIKRSIDLELSSGWKCIEVDPLKKINFYPSWIEENEVAVMLLDEKLHEQTSTQKKPVDYNGHDLVAWIRERMPTFPLFIVTSFDTDRPVQEKSKDVEDIINREKFTEEAAKYVPRIVRSGQKFIETFGEELEELARISGQIAKGVRISAKDKRRATVIRQRVEIAYDINTLSEREQLLSDFEKELQKLQAQSEKMTKLLKKKSKK